MTTSALVMRSFFSSLSPVAVHLASRIIKSFLIRMSLARLEGWTCPFTAGIHRTSVCEFDIVAFAGFTIP